MENDIVTTLKQQEEKINAIYESVEKTRKYFVMTMWVTLIGILLPAIILSFVLPSFLNSYVNSLSGM